MPKCLHFYMDDSGSRYPDHNPANADGERDFFALGGCLISDGADEGQARALHDELCERWQLRRPLHSVEIRNASAAYSWLHGDDARRQRFYEALHSLVKRSNALALACVIDRRGYNTRYREKYGNQRWMLCKTAFSIAIERAVRVAHERGWKLRVYVEKCNKKDDNLIRAYYDELKQNGTPFDAERAAKYGPLGPEVFRGVLYDLKFKEKTSPMIQLADLMLYPIARGGYEPEYRAYRRMMEDGCVLDCHLEEADLPHRGVKYSCFEGVRRHG